MVQEQHYYPFGLSMVGLEKRGSPQHRFLFNGIERDESFGLNISQALYRSYDNTLGRWWQVDPEAEQFYGMSPYGGMGNNPVNMVDPDGDLAFIPAILIGAGIGVLTNGVNNSMNQQSFFNGAGHAALFGAISGAVSAGIGNVISSVTNAATIAAGGTLTAGTKIGIAGLQAGLHGFSGGMMSAVQGGSFESGFLSGAISSGLGSASEALKLGDAGTFLVGGLSGGIGSKLAGGNFMRGVGQGLITTGLNHLGHDLMDFLYSLAPTNPDYNGDGFVSGWEKFLYTVEWGGYLFDAATVPSGEGVAIAAGVKMIGKNLGKQLTKQQLKSIKSFRKRILEHQQKLRNYKTNPLKYDNKGHYKNAPNNQIRQRVYQGRIKVLQDEIRKFENEIRKIQAK